MRLLRVLPTVVLFAALLAMALPTLAQEPNITFEGHGWGHGVGMSQYGAKAMAQAGHSADEIVEYYYTGAKVVPLGDALSGWLVDHPTPLWVNLTGTPFTTAQKVSFATTGGVLTFCQQEPASVGLMYEAKNKHEYSPYVELLEKRLDELGFNPGPVDGWFTSATTQAVKDFQSARGLVSDGIVGPATKNALWPPESGDRCVIKTPLGSSPRTLTPSANGNECMLTGAFAPGDCIGSVRGLSETTRLVIPERKVRNGTAIELAHGSVRVRPDRVGGTGSFQGLHVLLEIGIDDYVKGIDEIIFAWSSVANESLKAQAIASRAYAVGTARGLGPESGFSGARRDFCWCHLWSNTYSQVYAGYYTETLSNGVWKAAANATAGKILKHPSAGVVTAFYSSSSGGATEANEDVWGGSPVPYLRSVSDPWSLDTSPPFPNPFANWSFSFAPATVAARVGLDEVTGVAVVATNQSGSARTVRFGGTVNGSPTTVDRTGSWVRINFGLRSNHFNVSWGDPPRAPSPPHSSGTFTDTAGNTFEADIEWLAKAGVTKGCNPPDNTRFCPHDHVTRGQMAAFLNRYFNLPAASRDYFNDDNGTTFENDINRLAEAGITRGCNPPTNDRFCPDQKVTREQMAAFLVRAFELTENSHSGFADVSASNTFHADIGRLATAGITRGCNPPDNTRYCPKDYVTRGQMAAFLHRADKLR
jgi:SpoIID/LytB domain protein